MVDELEFELTDFQGNTYRVRCFDHIANLVAQALIRLFDTKRPDAVDSDLASLVDGNETEELVTRIAELKAGKGMVEDDNEGLVDVLSDLSEDELVEFQEDVRPARLIIAKVSFMTITDHQSLTSSHFIAPENRLQDCQLLDEACAGLA